MSGKLVMMAVESNNNTGVTLRKVCESPNGGTPPVFVATRLVVEGKDGLTNLGFYQGTPVECDRMTKKVINKELNRLGFRSTGRGLNGDGKWVTVNTHSSGARIEMTVDGGKYIYHRTN